MSIIIDLSRAVRLDKRAATAEVEGGGKPEDWFAMAAELRASAGQDGEAIRHHRERVRDLARRGVLRNRPYHGGPARVVKP